MIIENLRVVISSFYFIFSLCSYCV